MMPHAPRSDGTPLRRSAWTLVVLVQLLTLGLAPLADAHHGGAAAEDFGERPDAVASHPGADAGHDCIGSPDDPCDPAHGHADCLLCRVLSAGALLPSTPRVAALQQSPVQAALRPAVEAALSSGAPSPHPARAPPRA